MHDSTVQAELDRDRRETLTEEDEGILERHIEANTSGKILDYDAVVHEGLDQLTESELIELRILIANDEVDKVGSRVINAVHRYANELTRQEIYDDMEKYLP